MFSTAGHFAHITCPLDEQCTLPSCLFKHSGDTAQRAWMTMQDEEQPVQAQPSLKRRRIDRVSYSFGTGTDLAEPSENTVLGATPKSPLSRSTIKGTDENGHGNLEDQSHIRKNTGKPSVEEVKSIVASRQRPISPPQALRKSTDATNGSPKEFLQPRMLSHAPAEHQTRTIYLKKLHEEMIRLNTMLGKAKDEEGRSLHLNDNQLIRLAVDEEEKIARESPSIYANVIKLRMVAYKKMTLEQWKISRLETQMKTESPASAPKPIQSTRPLDIDLSTEQLVRILPHLFAQQKGLEPFGYVTSPPTDAEIKKAKDGVEAAAGYEQCERCKTRFQVFPDRREDGALASGGRCTYHHGRVAFPDRDQTAWVTGPREKEWTCCGEPLSSVGCTIADSHVFKVYDGKRLASVLQYERTPENPAVPDHQAVCFDCEMGFTVLGMELIRLTATRWPDGEELLDILVRPLGTILDLNSRYSGVRSEHFAQARPYSQNSSKGKSDSGPLRIVDSPVAARKLLFGLLSPNTPLIGHAIENDLNAVRIVHPCIIDTVLLFPLPSGLPQRPSLKGLVKKLLWKDIQTAGAQGHDSKEDARATGDVVKLRVIREWRSLQLTGWRFDGSMLIPALSASRAIKPDAVKYGMEKKRQREETPGLNYD